MEESFNAELAKHATINGAVCLKKMFFEINKKGILIHGKLWITEPIYELKKMFPYWSESQTARIIYNLAHGGFLLRENLNVIPQNRTYSYAINVDEKYFI